MSVVHEASIIGVVLRQPLTQSAMRHMRVILYTIQSEQFKTLHCICGTSVNFFTGLIDAGYRVYRNDASYVTKRHLPDVPFWSLMHSGITSCFIENYYVSNSCQLQNETVSDQIYTPCNIKYMCVTSNIVGHFSLVYWGM